MARTRERQRKERSMDVPISVVQLGAAEPAKPKRTKKRRPRSAKRRSSGRVSKEDSVEDVPQEPEQQERSEGMESEGEAEGEGVVPLDVDVPPSRGEPILEAARRLSGGPPRAPNPRMRRFKAQAASTSRINTPPHQFNHMPKRAASSPHTHRDRGDRQALERANFRVPLPPRPATTGMEHVDPFPGYPSPPPSRERWAGRGTPQRGTPVRSRTPAEAGMDSMESPGRLEPLHTFSPSASVIFTPRGDMERERERGRGHRGSTVLTPAANWETSPTPRNTGNRRRSVGGHRDLRPAEQGVSVAVLGMDLESPSLPPLRGSRDRGRERGVERGKGRRASVGTPSRHGREIRRRQLRGSVVIDRNRLDQDSQVPTYSPAPVAAASPSPIRFHPEYVDEATPEGQRERERGRGRKGAVETVTPTVNERPQHPTPGSSGKREREKAYFPAFGHVPFSLRTYDTETDKLVQMLAMQQRQGEGDVYGLDQFNPTGTSVDTADMGTNGGERERERGRERRQPLPYEGYAAVPGTLVVPKTGARRGSNRMGYKQANKVSSDAVRFRVARPGRDEMHHDAKSFYNYRGLYDVCKGIHMSHGPEITGVHFDMTPTNHDNDILPRFLEGNADPDLLDDPNHHLFKCALAYPYRVVIHTAMTQDIAVARCKMIHHR
ncbi:hypothetical protein KIPB_004385 [Kipferlia bialata]|uniref:Uncharacterized protein n=1 Tax=Kipferlia bialata TaxID=797122 RepID=A0A9K3CVD4_9EUKA|nr:hypothetical protein KIPB_004385 [Kipferlia bialata]|eukprot:g4385.t1